MKIKLAWFQKAEKVKAPDDAHNPAAVQQGNYTDYQQSPYSLRMQVAPMYGDELEAFDWIMNHMAERHPEYSKQSDLIDFAEDEGWLTVDDKGMLRVSDEAPE